MSNLRHRLERRALEQMARRYLFFGDSPFIFPPGSFEDRVLRLLKLKEEW